MTSADFILDQADAEPQRAPVGAVASAMRILAYLGAARTPLRLTQISRPLGINTSTCLNILRTLASQGFVRADPAAKTYALGRRLVELARDALASGENLGQLRPAMEAVALSHGMTVMLWARLDPESLILLAVAIGEPLRSIHAELGMRVPLLTGSMGRLFAATLEPARLAALFDRSVWHGRMTLQAYAAEVAEAARRGWSLDAGAFHAGLWGISVSATPPGAALDRVLNAVFPAGQHGEDAIARIAEELRAIAAGREFTGLLR